MQFYFTIPTKYSTNTHVIGASPNAWISVYASDENRAREILQGICGSEWASCYSGVNFHEKYFPEGCAMAIHDSGEMG